MLKDLLRKRLLATLVAGGVGWLTAVFQDKLGLSPEATAQAIDAILTVLITYVGGQSLSDAVAVYKGTKAN